MVNTNASNPKSKNRRDFLLLSTITFIGVGILQLLGKFFGYLKPSSDVLAQATVEVNILDIAVGQTKKVMWQGKPVFIRRRNKDEINAAKIVKMEVLPDPELDEKRTQMGKEEWLIVIGICTHLGCIPLSNKGDYGGWFCPCHGSHYDVSGRIRKGPAPRNLPVPYYTFISDDRIRIGKEQT